MSFPKYQTYRDSQVDWIGNIPSEWRVAPLKSIARVINGYPFDASLFDSSEGYPLIRIRDLNKSTPDARYKGEFIEAASIDNDDVLVGMDGEFNVGRWFGEVPALLNQRMCCIRAATRTLTRYLQYVLPRPLKAINDVTYSTTVKHLSSFDVLKIRVAMPPTVSEIQAVVDFLDSETAKIDALVEEQKRLIELLKEKRQAVISQAVTKGLDPNVPMKDSGVEWLGEVPAHWEVKTIKRCCTTTSGGTPNTAQQELYYTDETGIPWVRTMDLANEVLTSVEVYITEQALKDTACKVLPPGTVMVAMYGGDGTVGKNGLLGIPAAINQAVCGLLPSESVVSEYMFRYIQFFRPFWMVGAESSRKDPNISQERVRNAPALLPPREEQLAIAEYLRLQSDCFDALSAEARRAVDLLLERRSALISAAVTGKIDVRDFKSQAKGIAA